MRRIRKYVIALALAMASIFAVLPTAGAATMGDGVSGSCVADSTCDFWANSLYMPCYGYWYHFEHKWVPGYEGSRAYWDVGVHLQYFCSSPATDIGPVLHGWVADMVNPFAYNFNGLASLRFEDYFHAQATGVNYYSPCQGYNGDPDAQSYNAVDMSSTTSIGYKSSTDVNATVNVGCQTYAEQQHGVKTAYVNYQAVQFNNRYVTWAGGANFRLY